MTTGLSKIGKTAGTVFGGIAKVSLAAVGAASSGIMALGTSAVKSYAEFEQLKGGIETLFGAGGASIKEYAESVGKSVSEVNDEYTALMDAQYIAMDNANNAYKTAGMSANDYMSTVTGFAASLKQSTESELEAVKAADQALIDMSDNANKMGTSMESIQNAYQGFAKQNYTMLDNLKLGYGGTKEEMQRLLDDAEKLSGVKYDISSLSDVYSAIHVVQTELGITGTTAKEASSTISGSLNAMSAAWSNLVVGIADDSQDFDTLVDNFVETAVTAGENILPRVETAIDGIGQLIEGMLPVIMDRIPDIINDVLPDLVQSGVDMVGSIVDGIEQNLPQIVQGASDILMLLVNTFIEMLPQLLEMGLQVIIQLAIGISQALPELIPTVVDVILTLVDTLINNIDLLVDAAIQLITGLTLGIVQALPILMEKGPEIIIKLVSAIIDNLPKILEAAIQIVLMLASGIVQSIPKAIKAMHDIVEAIKKKITDTDWLSVGKNIIEGIKNGIVNFGGNLIESVKELATGAFESAKEALGIHSPSTKFKWIGEMCAAGWGGGFNDGMEEEMNGDGFETIRNMAKTSYGNIQRSSAYSGNGGNYRSNVTVLLKGDARQFFKVMRVENDKYVRSTGNPAFS